MNLLRPAIAAVAAALLGAYYFHDKARVQRSMVEEAAEDRLMVFDRAQVTRIEIANPGGTLVLEKRDDLWVATNPSAFRADATLVDTLLGNIQGAKRTRRFAAVSDDAYGFDKPLATVAITLASGGTSRTETIRFGSGRGQPGRVYARLGDSRETFTVGDWVARGAERSIEEWRDRALTSGVPENVASLRITTSAGTAALARGERRWSLETGEVKSPADASLVDRALAALRRGRLTERIDNPTSTTAQLGFDKPTAVVEADGRPVLRVGTMLPDGKSFAVELDGGAVGVAPDSLVADFMRPPMDWGTKRFVWADAEDITRIESRASETASLLIERRDGHWTFPEFPGEPVNGDRAAELLRDITDLAAIAYIGRPDGEGDALREWGLHRPVLTLKATTRSGEVLGFQVGLTDVKEGRTYMRRIQDGTVWAIDFTRSNRFYMFRRDLEERRIAPGIAEKVTAFDARLLSSTFTFRRENATAWRGTGPDGKSALIPAASAELFLQALQGLEWESRMTGDATTEAKVSFTFHGGDPASPVLVMDVLEVLKDTGERVVRTDKGTFTVPGKEFMDFDGTFSIMRNIVLKEAERAPGK